MRLLSCLSSFVLLMNSTALCCSELGAQESFRIKRDSSQSNAGGGQYNGGNSQYNSAGNPYNSGGDQSDNDGFVPSKLVPLNAGTYKPLNGSIEHRSYQPPGQLQPMQGRTDSNQLRGNANGNNLQSMADTTQIRAAVNNMPPLPAGINGSNGFRTGIPNFDNSAPPPFQLDTRKTRLPGDVSQPELNLLKSRDIVIMQDRSSSMGEHENFPQGYAPRWYWCLSQALDFKRQTLQVPNWLFTLVLFSSKYDVYRNVSMEMMPSLFDRNHIWIGTKLAAPVADQLNEYFQRRSQGHVKPLLIAIVTDGKPQDEHDLADVIIQATQHLQSPNEIHITFLQVGTDDESNKKLWKLDQGLMQKGAKYDIVSVMPFEQVTHAGLTRSLLQAVHNAGRN